MSWIKNRILPHLTHRVCSSGPIAQQREKIVPLAQGDVLEIGVGSGLNFPFYDKSKIEKIWALEPSAGMRKLARANLEGRDLSVEFIDLPGEQIPLEEDSVDTVLMTYTLCTISDPLAALKGMRRVLRPGGRLLFCEHGISSERSVRMWQNLLNPLWSKLSSGCNMNRDVLETIRAGGFRIETAQQKYIQWTKVLAYNYWGSAVAK
jgi:ubiquinone/menaquinone biosynthesis C-methylase UbiE